MGLAMVRAAFGDDINFRWVEGWKVRRPLVVGEFYGESGFCEKQRFKCEMRISRRWGCCNYCVEMDWSWEEESQFLKRVKDEWHRQQGEV